MDSLYLVLPAYNEEENINTVVRARCRIVSKIGASSHSLVIDDGSRDSTYEKLLELSAELTWLHPITKQNSRHGSTVLLATTTPFEWQAIKDFASLRGTL